MPKQGATIVAFIDDSSVLEVGRRADGEIFVDVMRRPVVQLGGGLGRTGVGLRFRSLDEAFDWVRQLQAELLKLPGSA